MASWKSGIETDHEATKEEACRDETCLLWCECDVRNVKKSIEAPPANACQGWTAR